MKIYEIGTGYTPIPARMGAATEIVVEELTKAFIGRGIDAEIIDISAANRPRCDLPIREVKVPQIFSRADLQLGIVHKLKRVVYSVALAGVLRKILRDAPDQVVLHFHNQYNLFFFNRLVSRNLRKKALVAYTNHSGIWRLPWERISDTIGRRYFQEAECMKTADIVFALNQETIDNANVHLGIARERFVLIGNGVNTDVYTPLNREKKEEARREFGFEGKKVILQVGSVYENKGQVRSVEKLAPVLKKYPELVFVYAGGIVSNEYQTKVAEMAERLGVTAQVKYLGMIQPGEPLNRLYNCAAATIISSEFEAFCLVKIESMAAGIPVLIDKTSMLAVEPGCVETVMELFNEQTEQILMDEEAQNSISAAARENVLVNYSWKRIAGDYLAGFGEKIKSLSEE